jgi:hypothetical protein
MPREVKQNIRFDWAGNSAEYRSAGLNNSEYQLLVPVNQIHFCFQFKISLFTACFFGSFPGLLVLYKMKRIHDGGTEIECTCRR